MLRNKEPELAEKIDTHSGVLTSVFTASISFLAPGTLLLSRSSGPARLFDTIASIHQ